MEEIILIIKLIWCIYLVEYYANIKIIWKHGHHKLYIYTYMDIKIYLGLKIHKYKLINIPFIIEK